MKRVISKKKLNLAGRMYGNYPVLAGSIVETVSGFDAVLMIFGFGAFKHRGNATFDEARQAVETLLLNSHKHPEYRVPEGWENPKKSPASKSRAKAKVTETHESGGKNARSHGRYRYTVTAETEGQIKYIMRQMYKQFGGYGMSFGELETIDGVLTVKGTRSDNCE